MSGVNRVTILGHLGKDPTHRVVGSSSLVQFSVAVTESWKKGNERVESTEWIPVKCWGSESFADFLLNNLSKGSKVYVEGKFKTEKYQKGGEDRYATFLVVQSFSGCVELMSGSGGSGAGRGGGASSRDSSGQASGGSRERQQAQTTKAADFDLDDEIPF